MSTTPSPLLLLLLLVASPLASSDPPTIPGCPQATCGDAKIDLYPFWLPPTANKTNSSSVCGYLGLDLICLDGNLTKRTPSAYYTILDIDKKARTLTVVDSARRESSCTRPLHNLTHDQIHPLHYAPGVVNYTFYFNCSSKLDRYIPCFADAGQGYSYLVAPGDVYREKLYDRCEYTVEVPVSEASPADAGYGDDVKAQFQLAWDEPDEECEDCERSGGRCAFKEDDRLGFTFSCRCDDAEHRKDCGDGNGGTCCLLQSFQLESENLNSDAFKCGGGRSSRLVGGVGKNWLAVCLVGKVTSKASLLTMLRFLLFCCVFISIYLLEV